MIQKTVHALIFTALAFALIPSTGRADTPAKKLTGLVDTFLEEKRGNADFIKIKNNNIYADKLPAELTVNEHTLRSWLETDLFPYLDFTYSKQGNGSVRITTAHRLATSLSMAFDTNVLPEGTQTPVHVNAILTDAPEILDHCRFYGRAFWQIAIPYAYQFETGGKAASLEQTAYFRVTKALRNKEDIKKGEPREELVFDHWDGRTPGTFCNRVRNWSLHSELVSHEHEAVFAWVKDHLSPVNYGLDNAFLFFPQAVFDLYEPGALTKYAAPILFMKETTKAGFEWDMKASGTVVLSDEPLFYASCLIPKTENTPEKSVWQIEWPARFTIQTPAQSYERQTALWITVVSADGKTLNITQISDQVRPRCDARLKDPKADRRYYPIVQK